MRTTVTKRSRIAITVRVREKFGIRQGDALEWMDDGQSIKVIPLRGDPISALKGCAKGSGLGRILLAERRKDPLRDG
ncbi:MAG TPA: AbrB/MazE/SpoVT family DNA-binding domain-containing protein [Spirochaetia bacterium]|nr:AbrB/MazE/SpoVT family DNA-binding domain-containing protein [Spirochaetia bacterium]